MVLVQRHASLIPTRESGESRDLQRWDIDQVKGLLAILPELYPGGDVWLESRLDDVLGGHARCTVVEKGNELAGVAIETPKAEGRLKLSTFFVADGHRNCGVGGSLMRTLHDRWVCEGIEQVHVTVAEQNYRQVKRVFEPVGFLTVAHELDRYGAGRNEFVMTCLVAEGKRR